MTDLALATHAALEAGKLLRKHFGTDTVVDEATDHDIKLAMRGFPSPGAPRDYLVSWLRGMAKLQDLQAQNDNGRAEWIAGNGNLGTAKRDLYVNGVQIPKGTSFVDYQKRSTAVAGRQAVPPRSYMEFAK